MAVIKRSDAETHLTRAVTLDLGDLQERGRVLREAATAEAERIVREAHAERDRLVATAAEEGRAEGHAEGMEKGLAEGRALGEAEALAQAREEFAALDASWSDAMAAFMERRETLLVEARTAVVELALAIAERVVHRHIETDPSAVVAQLETVIGLVTAPSTLVVRVHPEDERIVREALPRLRERFVGGVHVRLRVDAGVSRGSCIASTLGGASIDASVERQLDRLARDLVPDRGVEDDRERRDGGGGDGP